MDMERLKRLPVWLWVLMVIAPVVVLSSVIQEFQEKSAKSSADKLAAERIADRQSNVLRSVSDYKEKISGLLADENLLHEVVIDDISDTTVQITVGPG